MHYLPDHSENGQGLVEYGLILVLVSIVVFGILSLVGGQIGEVFQEVTNAMASTG